MNCFANDQIHFYPTSTSLEEDIVIKKILLTHDPDGRRLDSELLLTAIENVMYYTTSTSEVRSFHIDVNALNDISNIEIVGAEESLGLLISKISYEVNTYLISVALDSESGYVEMDRPMWNFNNTCLQLLFKSSSEGDLHARTIVLFDLLRNYRLDAKLVLILAAFATNYGELCLLMQQYLCNPLAASVAQLKQLPNDLSMLKPRFKALSMLVKTLVDLTKCIINFECLPFRHVKLDDQAMATAKSYIYLASYWVTRSTLACSSQITDLIGMKPEQVLKLNTNASWQLTSLVYRLSSMCSSLSRQVDLCHQQLETKLYQKLLNLFQEAYLDNQEVLGVLLALKDDLPLKNSSTQAKADVSELKGKIVILLLSKPDLLPLEGLLLLVHQTNDHPHHKKLEQSYEIVWLPISFSDAWTHSEASTFNFLSNSLPWYSIRRPWSLSSAVVNYIKQTWDFKDYPVMVVLDSQGKVTNSNAIDMFLIWGAKAYPFSSSRENQLWEEQNWTMQLLLNEIDPLLTRWVEEGRNICIYGSDNLEWIREFNSKLKNIKSDGVQLEMVYVGKRNLNEHVRCILDIINGEIHTSLLPFTKLHFFWLRLESMIKSTLRLVQSISCDHIQKELLALLDSTEEGWAIMGRGNTTDIIKLRGRKSTECLSKFSEWRENIAEFGLMGALRTSFETPPPSEPCNYSNILPYAEELVEGIVLCEKCNRPMKKYVVYE